MEKPKLLKSCMKFCIGLSHWGLRSFGCLDACIELDAAGKQSPRVAGPPAWLRIQHVGSLISDALRIYTPKPMSTDAV